MGGRPEVRQAIRITRGSAYQNNREPLKQVPLLRLPPGSIRPFGWLERQLDLMVDGVTGRLPEFGEYFRPERNGWLYHNDEGRQEVPYWLRGFVPLSILTQDRRCLGIAEEYCNAILNSQDSDGFFGPRGLKTVRGQNGQVICNLSPHMLVLYPIIEYCEYAKDARVLPFLTRFFEFCRDIPEESFCPVDTSGFYGWGGKAFGSPLPFRQSLRAGDMLPHLFWYFNRTGEAWTLDLARRFYSHIRPPWDEWLDHHAVNFPQRFAFDGLYHVLSRDDCHLARTEYWYSQHMSTWGQMPRGIFAADERIRSGCTDPRQAFETCGMVEFAKSFYELGRITGNVRYADQVEDLLLNHFTAAYTPDQKALHYLTAANMPQLDASIHHLFRNESLAPDRSYIAYTPHNRCCGHNGGMGWTWYASNLWQATGDSGLAAWMYADCDVTARVGDAGDVVSIRQETEYPFRGSVSFTVKTEQPTRFPLYLRIPRWCVRFAVSVNDADSVERTESGTWVLVHRVWKGGDRVSLLLHMNVTHTRWSRNGSVTVERGPLSFSLKIDEDWRKQRDLGSREYATTDERWPNWEVYPKSPWNYGLCLDHNGAVDVLHVREKETPGREPWTTANAPIEITVRGRRIPEWTLQDETVSELQPGPIRSDQPVEELALIPEHGGAAGPNRSAASVVGRIGSLRDLHDGAQHWSNTLPQDYLLSLSGSLSIQSGPKRATVIRS